LRPGAGTTPLQVTLDRVLCLVVRLTLRHHLLTT
jgi:hypothetical protein